MSLAWPWIFVLLPLPWLIWRFAPGTSRRDPLEHPYLASWVQREGRAPASSGRQRGVWLWLVWALLLVALARPQTVGEPIMPEQPGRSLMLVVDMSRSMLEEDMTWQGRYITRYQAVQNVVGDFVRQRQGDALGLVVFGDFADIQAPLTPDIEAVRELLLDLIPGMAGNGTAIGDGLGLAVKRLRDVSVPDKVIVLLSDGENNAGRLTPAEAAKAAAASDIRVHAIGFGGEPRIGLFGTRSGDGVDERALRNLAEQTGGQYFRARSTDELEAVYERIDELEPSALDGPEHRLAREWFWVPTALALGLLALGRLWPGREVAA
ncbi:VWA domain-containing protein [Saccharospirillum salsuginis]|uniref:VWFA domain-containing protein n=1 Tax=Saccharospirillum salsuginis TaxID=418750 RepID=A0A918KRW7_9GAMM|nr:VWA domain-containing protein [Saccharospirillum salsuginis]GGX73585.1 hypothetical protein GCM10007392_46310 [Saccharospirillum salsuginis]